MVQPMPWTIRPEALQGRWGQLVGNAAKRLLSTACPHRPSGRSAGGARPERPHCYHVGTRYTFLKCLNHVDTFRTGSRGRDGGGENRWDGTADKARQVGQFSEDVRSPKRRHPHCACPGEVKSLPKARGESACCSGL